MSGAPPTQRIEFLDGLRGWAALIVVFLHTFLRVLPPIDNPGAYIRGWWPLSGKFSVSIFFLVSGFALSIGFLRNQDRRSVVRMAAGRYFRLFIPIFVACALVSISMNTGIFPEPSERPVRRAAKFVFDPTLQHLLRFTFYDVFFNYTSQETYAGPLWTMSIELYGSFLVAILLFVFGRPRDNLTVYLLVMIVLLFLKSYLFLFLIGVLACDYYEEISNFHVKIMIPILMIIGAFLPVIIKPNRYALLIGSTIFFIAVIMSAHAKFAMSTKISRWLGTISFPLYLIHLPVLYVIGSPLYMVHQDSIASKIAIGFIAIIAAIIASILLIPVNTFAMKVSRFVGRNFVRLVYPKQQN